VVGRKFACLSIFRFVRVVRVVEPFALLFLLSLLPQFFLSAFGVRSLWFFRLTYIMHEFRLCLFPRDRFCNGQLLPIAQNTALFSLVGTTYGGDGRTTFGLPNLQGRVVMGPGNGPGLTNRRWGESGGTETVTLTQQQMPSHTHADTVAPEPHSHTTTSTPTVSDVVSGTCSLASSGSHVHNVLGHEHSYDYHVVQVDGTIDVVAYSVGTETQCMSTYVTSTGGQCFVETDLDARSVANGTTGPGDLMQSLTGSLPDGVCTTTGDVDLTGVSTSSANVVGTTQTSTPAFGSQQHNNMQPYLKLNYIIALTGIYPSRN